MTIRKFVALPAMRYVAGPLILALFATIPAHAVPVSGDMAQCVITGQDAAGYVVTNNKDRSDCRAMFWVSLCFHGSCKPFDTFYGGWYPPFSSGLTQVVACKERGTNQGSQAQCMSSAGSPAPSSGYPGSSSSRPGIGGARGEAGTTAAAPNGSSRTTPSNSTSSRDNEDRREYVDHAKQCVKMKRGKNDPQIEMGWYEIVNTCSMPIKVWVCDAIKEPSCNPVASGMADIAARGKSAGHWASTRNGRLKVAFVACPAKSRGQEVHSDREENACFYYAK